MNIGIILGKFKILHSGHVHTVEEALSQCDMVKILISPHSVDGITVDDAIWNFQLFFGNNPRIEYRITDKNPFKTLYEEVENQIKEGNTPIIYTASNDSDRYGPLLDKHPQLRVVPINRPSQISSSKLRFDLKNGDFKSFASNIPSLIAAKKMWNRFSKFRTETFESFSLKYN